MPEMLPNFAGFFNHIMLCQSHYLSIFFEGMAVSSTESFRSSVPGLSNIETIEPSVLHVITKSGFELYPWPLRSDSKIY
jgi:hypothetical protein